MLDSQSRIKAERKRGEVGEVKRRLKEFKKLVGNKGRWDDKFVDAMEDMMLLGVKGGKSKLIECTDFIPKGTTKRDVKRAPINYRIR